jgi:hypothetical protein
MLLEHHWRADHAQALGLMAHAKLIIAEVAALAK